MSNLLLKLGAVVIALLMAVILAQQFGVGLGIRIGNNLFASETGNIEVVSWLLVFLALLELITLVLLVLTHKSARSK